MRTIAIGDIHGFSTSLETLLALLNPTEDRLIFLGDTIDRGPHSRQVLEKLIELSSNPNHVFLRGNHDDWLLRARSDDNWFKMWLGAGVGGKETLRSYGAASFERATLSLIPDEHWKFLENTRLFFQTESTVFVHASLADQAPEDTDSRTLLWRSVHDIPPQPIGHRVICGHTCQDSGLPLDLGYAVCIDTSCSDEGWLSALDVDSNEVFQANERRQTRQFLLGQKTATIATKGPG